MRNLEINYRGKSKSVLQYFCLASNYRACSVTGLDVARKDTLHSLLALCIKYLTSNTLTKR
jgi:hypothetical protein